MYKITDVNICNKVGARTLQLIKKGVFVQIPTIFFDYVENSIYERTHSMYDIATVRKKTRVRPYNWVFDSNTPVFTFHYYKQVVLGDWFRGFWGLFEYIMTFYTFLLSPIYHESYRETKESMFCEWRYWDIDGYKVLNRQLTSEDIYFEHDLHIYVDFVYFRYKAILNDAPEYWRVITTQFHPSFSEYRKYDLLVDIHSYKKNGREGSILTYFLEDRVYLHRLFITLFCPIKGMRVNGEMPILHVYDQFTPVLFRFLFFRFRVNYFTKYFRHPYHILEPDMSPIIVGTATGEALYGLVTYFSKGYIWGFFWGFVTIGIGLSIWWDRVTAEASYMQEHNHKIKKGLKLGMALFIVSEVMFFFGFFWSYFHLSVNPSIWQGAKWPPLGTPTVSPLHIPLLNTVILLTSGTFVTISERFLRCHRMESAHFFASNKWWNNRFQIIGSVYLTIGVGLGFLFTLLQGLEYYKFDLKFSDGAYGSIFYIATGFHGLHVIIGALFLMVCLVRCRYGHFAVNITGLVMAAWYWHFVDVVWLFLYIVVYCWGQWDIPLAQSQLIEEYPIYKFSFKN